MALLGTIQLLQIQRESLKVDDEHGRHYDPGPLLAVAQLKLTAGGVVGVTDTGEEIIDVHHTGHPRSRNRADNFVSMGFTAHYAMLHSRYGDHLTEGIAGENIIVACDQQITPEMLGGRVVIETQAGVRLLLEDTLPIPPCEPFSRFAAGRDLAAPEMKATLQYLSDGTRGFYMRASSEADGALIQRGDQVYTVD